MSQDNLIKFVCTKCKKANYFSRKNRKKLAEVKLKPKKFCKHCKVRTEHKEMKK